MAAPGSATVDITWVDADAAVQALAEVRDDANPNTWALFSYVKGQKSQVEYVQSGQGDLNELKTALKEEAASFALYRTTDVIDNSVCVKFVFIQWIGKKVGFVQKGRISTHKGAQTQFVGQFHADIFASTLADLDADELAALIGDGSGSSVRVLDGEGKKVANDTDTQAAPSGSTNNAAAPAAARESSPAPTKSVCTSAPAAQVKSTTRGDLEFDDVDSIKSVLADLRSDACETDFVLFSYVGNSNVFGAAVSGSGGVEELKGHLQDDGISYGIVRVTEQIDNSTTVKFVMISWVGEKVRLIRKAKITTHIGRIHEVLGQYHTDLPVSDKTDLTQDAIMKRVAAASGRAVHVLDEVVSDGAYTRASTTTAQAPTRAAPAPAPVTAVTAAPVALSSRPAASSAGPRKAPQTGVNRDVQELTFEESDAVQQSFQALRSNDDDTDWVVLGYSTSGGAKSTTISEVAHGSDGLAGLHEVLKDDAVNYALYRTTDVVDNTVNVKFVFIIWLGEKVKMIRKARISTHKGAVQEFVGQYHVSLEARIKSDISEEEIKQVVQKASGTANYVM
eukprot:TRINITY_DN3598_c0_g2_i1.p1 TRINITY_DN3598_c0_g2~~TRINITY_DN3598_c0_g2_i1.p1  ORF type:complete len:564 (-),score=165.66 TRINITY_DN3598_c0_g2_i1:164-1855(-)